MRSPSPFPQRARESSRTRFPGSWSCRHRRGRTRNRRRCPVAHRNVLGRLQYSLADFLGGLDARVGRIDHANEHHLIGLEVIANDSEDVNGIFLSRQRDEEGPGHELKETGSSAA